MRPGRFARVDRSRLIYRWDLDKTYLRTDFDTVRALWRTAWEPASSKRTMPGAAPLMRELWRTGPQAIHILSGSPKQMRKVLEEKLKLDGIRWTTFTLKPSLQQLMRGRVSYLRDQVGYKLNAMLESREASPADTDEVLFGDDSESDAFVYSIYADICAGRVPLDDLTRVLEQAKITRDEVRRIVRRAGRVPQRDMCRRIFIHLDRMSSPDLFWDYGARVCPFYNYFQPALVMLELGMIDAESTLRVAAELVIDHAFAADALLASYTDLSRRGHVGEGAAVHLIAHLKGARSADFSTATAVLVRFGEMLADHRSTFSSVHPLGTEPLDYVALFSRDKARAHAAKLRAMQRR